LRNTTTFSGGKEAFVRITLLPLISSEEAGISRISGIIDIALFIENDRSLWIFNSNSINLSMIPIEEARRSISFAGIRFIEEMFIFNILNSF